METVFLSLGSNLGDRKKTLEEGIGLLAAILSNIKVSALYETEPWGTKNVPPYLNAVIEGQAILFAHDLLREIQEIEKKCGREKTAALHAPRPLDIDILFYGNHIVKTDELTIPHPHTAERLFVLRPLAELTHDFVHPILKKTVWELLKDCKDNSSVRPYGT